LTVAYLLNYNTLDIMSSVMICIPEPGTFGLLGLGILCLRKRGRRS
jgi:hypothetical protein